MATLNLEEIILKLFDVQAVKFGSFTLKSGIVSPVYFDLRVLVSYPDLMSDVSEWLYRCVREANCQFTTICGVPYTALPLATCISIKEKIPMLIRRKEAKGYGTKKIIEGHFCKGDTCLIIEDVVTSGMSVLETVKSLEEEGLIVKDAVVLLDRQQGGMDHLKMKGITLHSVCGMDTLLQILQKAGKLTSEIVIDTQRFISENNTFKTNTDINSGGEHVKRKFKMLSYKERIAKCTFPLTKKLFTIMEEKQTNLALAADLTSCKQLLRLADTVGPYICILKTHIDILEDYNNEFIQQLTQKASKHNFLVFEDRKFADIGSTVQKQFSGGMYHMADWAHIINAHALPGPGIVDALKQVGLPKERGCLLIAEMSSSGNLAKDDYVKATVKLAEENSDFVMGFISQSRVSEDVCMVHMTPGVHLKGGSDILGQQYLTPDVVISQKMCDVIIVGRGITQAVDPVEAAKQYRNAGYKAYQSLISS